jgi:hypothetical protein
MKFTETKSFIYNGSFAREAWLNGQQVWPPYTQCYNWIKKPLATNPWTDITYGPPNTLVASGLNYWSYSTDNGNNWSALSILNPDPGAEFQYAIAYGNNKWSIIEFLNNPAGTNVCWTSTNILTGWTKSNFLSGSGGTTLNPILSVFIYPDMLFNPHNNKFVAFLDQRNQTFLPTNACVVYSDDGVNWLSGGYFDQSGNPITSPQGFGNGTIGTFMPNNRVVAVGGGGSHKFAYSDDGGITWKQGFYNPGPTGQNLQVGLQWSQVAYGYDNNQFLPLSGRYVACCSNGSTAPYQFAYSNDGTGWIGVSSTDTNLKRDWRCMTYGNGKFVALSNSGGYQAVSKDGINWTGCSNMPTTISNTDIVVANNRFVAVVDNEAGNNNAVITDFV